MAVDSASMDATPPSSRCWRADAEELVGRSADKWAERASRVHGGIVKPQSRRYAALIGIYLLIAVSYLLCLWLAARIQISPQQAPAAATLRIGLGVLLAPRELV